MNVSLIVITEKKTERQVSSCLLRWPLLSSLSYSSSSNSSNRGRISLHLQPILSKMSSLCQILGSKSKGNLRRRHRTLSILSVQ